QTIPPSLAYPPSVNVQLNAEGKTTLHYAATDNWGNVEATKSAIVRIDKTSPLANPPVAFFPANTQIDTSGLVPGIPVTVTWWPDSDTGGSGVIAYQLQRSVNGGAYSTVPLASQPSFAVTLKLIPNVTFAFRVRAQDRAGNWSSWKYGAAFTLQPHQESDSAISYTGTWTSQPSSGAWGGAVEHTTATGPSGSFSFSGRAVAWVAPRDTDGGQADVYVDGVKVTSVTLWAKVLKPRQVVYSTSWGASGFHTLKVVVTCAASSCSSRVSVDAFVVIRPPLRSADGVGAQLAAG